MTGRPTADLAAWLTAIWDEEERLARDAADEGTGIFRPHWTVAEHAYEGIDLRTDPSLIKGGSSGAWRTAETRHIERHDPASVLARIAADRAILAEFVARDKDVDLMLGPDCLRQREWAGLRLALWLKAEQYKDRPGFDPHWLDEHLGSRSHP